VADRARVPELEQYMDKLRKSGDSCGARLTVVASGVPAGWANRSTTGSMPTSRRS
jgi:chorismate synthase